eukprot:TRINITY_DN98314_c0_g1_i1.p1 TRINITY_DN98314_c0_g1~~TRINITY_DN98314_c0_g1_i1.p1  ORF type:complete len:184 (-),score=52.18 TRINITY_DN98314_c0_g1_i1:79-630(-)
MRRSLVALLVMVGVAMLSPTFVQFPAAGTPDRQDRRRMVLRPEIGNLNKDGSGRSGWAASAVAAAVAAGLILGIASAPLPAVADAVLSDAEMKELKEKDFEEWKRQRMKKISQMQSRSWGSTSQDSQYQKIQKACYGSARETGDVEGMFGRGRGADLAECKKLAPDTAEQLQRRGLLGMTLLP